MKQIFFVPGKIAKVLLTVAFILICGVLFAQGGADSTISTTTGSLDGLIQSIGSWLAEKWPIIGTIGTILLVISEALAAIPSVKANSVYQLITGWLKRLFGNKTNA